MERVGHGFGQMIDDYKSKKWTDNGTLWYVYNKELPTGSSVKVLR